MSPTPGLPRTIAASDQTAARHFSTPSLKASAKLQRARHEKRALLLVTDGNDDASRIRQREALAALRSRTTGAIRRHLKPTNKSWRVDDTYVRVKGCCCDLYRAIDSAGATIGFLLSGLRDADAAKRLFHKALSNFSHPQPRVIDTDLAPIYGSAISDIKKEGTLHFAAAVGTDPLQYLNNIIEQDHRAIKRRVKAKQGFREFQGAQRTIQGYEAMNMMRKGLVRWVSGTDVGVEFSSSTSSSNQPPEIATSTGLSAQTPVSPSNA